MSYIQTTMEALKATFILLTVLCKVQTTTATGDSTANTTRLGQVTAKYISDDHRNSTNSLSQSQSVEDYELCPQGMFSPKSNVCVNCTLRCPFSMYISTPCSAEMDTQCSFCPQNTSLWNVNMNNSCTQVFVVGPTVHVLELEDVPRGVQSVSIWTRIVVFSIPILLLLFVFEVICFRLRVDCCGYQSPMYWKQIKIILCWSKKKVEKWIRYTAVNTEEHMGDDMPIESGNNISEDLDEEAKESFITHNELEGQSYCKSDVNLAAEHVPIEMKPLGRHTCTSQVEVHSSPIWEQPHISFERLPQVSSGYKLSKSLTETDTSSALSILSSVTTSYIPDVPRPIMNDRSSQSSCSSLVKGPSPCPCKVANENSMVSGNIQNPSHLPQKSNALSSSVIRPSGMGVANGIQDDRPVCPTKMLYNKFCDEYTGGIITCVDRSCSTPILEKRLDLSYCSSSSLSSTGSSIVGHVKFDKHFDIV